MNILNIKNNKKGFSLIEVAIAIIVISLIVGFGLKGKELIHTAKINSIIEQVNTFRMATQMFMDKYNAIPGDLTNAKQLIDPSLENGYGNSQIRTLSDAKRFWRHLTTSGLLSIELVNGFPISKIGGYYSITTNISGNEGIWIVLSKGTTNNSTFSGLLSQEDAYLIDKKYDNGIPSTGEIRTLKVSGSNLVSIEQQYDLKNKENNCIMIFRLW
ncbi:MAG: prepilin-type N-terminal cleavage/methylation domain-containing protein [Alphaproteobacteria bacterium]|nr:prepilin-type N-terminal cleavage/methylation domain-containing protein [Alphaproteobacteria bacterium]